MSEIKKILFNGSSWTYGAELDEACGNSWKDHRYSSYVSKHFNCDHLNIASNGASNDKIVRTTLEEIQSNHYDLIIIQWTIRSRTEINNTFNYSDFTYLAPTRKKCNKSEIYYSELYGPIMGTINYQKNKYLLSQYLKSKNINYFYIDYYKRKEFNTPFDVLPQDEDILVLNDIIKDKDYCKGNNHPNSTGHKKIADLLINYIITNNIL